MTPATPATPATGVEPLGLVAGLDVLQRSLDYTSAALAAAEPHHLDRPTPCRGWNLADLLAHMEDALDAFAEAAAGTVRLGSLAPTPLEERVGRLQEKACRLLTRWLAAGPGSVDVGGHPLPVDRVARIAALEIAVHGWDVDRATGAGVRFPDELAVALLPTAATVGAGADPGFAPTLPVADSASPEVRLVGLLGRRTS